MIPRSIKQNVISDLTVFDSVALLGPRQVGKTTLAHQISDEWESEALYLDLEKRADREQLGDNPLAYFSRHSNHLIVLDEIHRTPEIFQDLRVQIDEHRRNKARGRFLFLGSASMSLMRQSTESLAGRMSYADMAPLNFLEVWEHAISRSDNPEKVINQLWLHGGFPLAYLHDTKHSLEWRNAFIRTYLERDLPQYGLRVSSDRMDLFWRMIAMDQGAFFNAKRYTESLGVSGNTVRYYRDISRQLLMVRELQPWFGNFDKRLVKRLVKSSRLYVRDSGVLHSLLDVQTIENLISHPVSGKSWKGFVIENLVESACGKARPYFYRTSAGAEIDLVLQFAAGKCWAFEITLSTKPTLTRGFHSAANDIQAERRILVCPGKESYWMRHDVEVMPLLDTVKAVNAAVNG